MRYRPRVYQLPTAAVLAVLSSQGESSWRVGEVAEAMGRSYGSAYSILEKLTGQSVVRRVYFNNGIGQPKLHYELTKLGWETVERVLKYMPDPVEALDHWTVADDFGTRRPDGETSDSEDLDSDTDDTDDAGREAAPHTEKETPVRRARAV